MFYAVDGLAERTYDIPTKSEECKEQFQQDFQIELPSEWRKVRSRYSTSICDVCKEPIMTGELIARKETTSSTSWVHARCVCKQTAHQQQKKHRVVNE